MNDQRPLPGPDRPDRIDERRVDAPAEALGAPAPVAAPVPRRRRLALSPLNQRRWRNFTRNRRAYWSLWIFALLFGLSLFAELLANDRPLLVQYRGELYTPLTQFYSERTFGGDVPTEAIYRDVEVRCLIKTGGYEECYYEPEDLIARIDAGETVWEDQVEGWVLDPLIPYGYRTIVDRRGSAPGAPDVIGFYTDETGERRFGLLPPDQRGANLLGTDRSHRDVMARVIYGFRLSILFTLIVTGIASLIGIALGAIQGYFGGWTDLLMQRFIEIWGSTPSLYIIIILFAILGRSFWLLVFITTLFAWPALVGVVRAEFLRARNFEYVRAARALGVRDGTIMLRHVLPNALVATVTLLPFLITGGIGTLASLDFLGFGLPSSAPSLGELTLQAKNNLQAPWLAFTAFFTFAIMLSLLVFIFEGVRDAFDPRKTFQ
ncbi:microcin C transport system permease protein [Hasllibacter halocynthiae]|uniref:Microcin C transport system permease protein n=1 Tax=Hasllibacter halocynthiae TaxID=595589 RepID=A0A2T0X410_9RHOB|nr:ABC transporter permease [Hasllibacter halocynthiae]PRY93686.1 microcin C transport system permease protein [Hasllibacter halocynthiae]